MPTFRPEHFPLGDPCVRPNANGLPCNVPAHSHRVGRSAVTRKTYYRDNAKRWPRPKRQDLIVAVDGEGQGRAPHLYTFLAAVGENGRRWSVRNDAGLSTEQCLALLVSLPDRSLVVGFALTYDLTKALADLPNHYLYQLFHEESRAYYFEGRIHYAAINWRGFRLNYMNRRLTIERHGKRITVWDIFRFFQSKFTQALKDWQIGDPARIAWIEEMKDKRAEFDKLPPAEVEAYCFEECTYLCQLVRALIEAHKNAGLELRDYYGAGSTAKAFLERINVKRYMGDRLDNAELRHAIACAFFGGRFENGVVGPIPGPIYNYDINSAYPYHATQLPCLACGTWRYSENNGLAEIEGATLALVRWVCDRRLEIQQNAWGALPTRTQKGTILFPLAASGGWCWRAEYLAARRFTNDNVHHTAAWLYHTDCNHRPFETIPATYLERLALGEDAKGIVLKLGLNSIYGKTAQSKGLNPPYQSWVFAGNITSGCRAQLLDAMHASHDSRAILMLATDGIFTRERLSLPQPVDLGASTCRKPLGGWAEKVYEAGIFAVRPGIYFPLNPTDKQLKDVRARGLGKKILYEQWPKVIDAWERGAEKITVAKVQRFIGAKTGVLYSTKGGYRRKKTYGEWIEDEIKVSFSPLPKRLAINDDCSLQPIDWWGEESVPYDAALKDPDAIMLALAEQIAEEQPNVDMEDIQ